MHSIEIAITKRFIWFQFLNIVKRKVPTEWNELTARQLVRVCRAIALSETEDELKCRLIPILLRIPASLYWAFSSEQIALQLWPLTEFILKSNTLTKNLQKKIYSRFRRWIGPDDELANVSLLEFAYADTFFMRYHETKDQKWLDNFIASLYRPRDRTQDPRGYDFSGDSRKPFNSYLIEHNAKRLSRLSVHVKEGILMWYWACRMAMEQRYPYVFKAKGSGAKPTSWPEFITALGGGKFGTVNQVGQERFHTVMIDANSHIENLERKKK